jgi:dCMP deaminase
MRLSWEQYALRLAQTAALRSEDPYVQVGAVALRHDNSIGGIGYNGAPAGVDIDWSSRDSRRPYVIHAEPNALRYTRPGECYMLVTTLEPCSNCITIAATYGIKQIRFLHSLVDSELSKRMAEKFGIKLQQIPLDKNVRPLRLEQRPSKPRYDKQHIKRYVNRELPKELPE